MNPTIEDVRVSIDHGNDETVIAIRVGDKMHCIPDPFARAIANRLDLAERVLLAQAQGGKMVSAACSSEMSVAFKCRDTSDETWEAMHAAAVDMINPKKEKDDAD